MPDTPYKFLDFYSLEDEAIFAGRRKEANILLDDILASKLVVLYAKTGTGKSSLINAAVRPALARLEYASVLVRVERDPTRSSRLALAEAGLLDGSGGPSGFASMARAAARKADAPLVIFLDQFEEFFLYLSQDEQQQFISQLADIYCDGESEIHIVLSMREEFFYYLDSFRDHIPRIFHKESNLRLRWLTPDAATEAIIDPSARLGVIFDREVVNGILQELIVDGLIEPARLQIVCDTLWRKRERNRIDATLFHSLGGAKRILDSRLEEDFEQHFTDPEMRIFQDLIGELSSDEGTKKIRALDDLHKRFGRDILDDVIDKLSELRLLRRVVRDQVNYVEWPSDYLAERAAVLSRAVRRLWFRRLVARAVSGTNLGEDEFAQLSDNLEEAGEIPASALNSLLDQALVLGAFNEIYCERALAAGLPVVTMLRRNVLKHETPVTVAENAVRLLGRIGTKDAYDALEEALQREDVAYLIISVLAAAKSPLATETLRYARRRAELADTIEATLEERPIRDRVAESQTHSLIRPLEDSVISEILHRLSRGLVIMLGTTIDGQNPDERCARFLLNHAQVEAPPNRYVDLPTAAEIFAALFSRNELLRIVSSTLSNDKPPSPEHRFFANLPGNPILLTTSYDRRLETALKETGRPFVELRPARDGGWLLRDSNTERVLKSNEISDFGRDTTAVVKLRGTLSEDDDSNELVILTEEDYWTMLLDETTLPAYVRAATLQQGVLFVDVRANVWHSRLLVKRIQGERLTRVRSFAVSPAMSYVEANFWKRGYTQTFSGTPKDLISRLHVAGGDAFIS